MINNITKEEKNVLLKNLISRLANMDNLTEWEKSFLESVKKQLSFRDLSEKQINVLNKIKKKYNA
jgi:archaellum biogenesis protein FlaJ (TadC family)